MDENILYYGDNLDVLRRHIKDESVDLIYLDPPFKSNQDYNVLFAEQDGSRAAAQIKAFEDTWRWDRAAASAYQETVERGGKVSQAMQAFRLLLGDSDTLAYLAMMAPRLVELQRKLKPAGSIYLHCDPTASHYLKLLLDAVCGTRNFRNEIVWRYQKYQKHAMGYFTRNSDRILWYVKSQADYTFNPQFMELEQPKRYLKRVWDKETGRIVNAKDAAGHVQYISVDRQKIDDVWAIPYLMPASHERLGYPTQKPEALLERIINASSKPGDVVLDPFCGCGTAIAIAQRLNRRWIGIDITHLAVTLIKHRLRDTFGDTVAYRVVGEPVSVSDAQVLAESDPYQFQWWALGLVGARPVEQKKGADKGIDGRLYFHDEGAGSKTKQIILSVKSGHATVAHVRDLRGVLEREQAEIGVLISMQDPTQPMRVEAAGAGFYASPWSGQRHPHVQILTVADLLAGRGIDYPRYAGNVTFKKAPRNHRVSDAQAAYLPPGD